MPARTVVDIALLDVALPTGNVRLQEVMSFEINETDPGAEAVKTMRQKRRAIGVKHGVPDFEITLEVKPVVGQEVDWLKLKRDGTYFNIYYEENDGGQRFRVEDCVVTEVQKSFNAEGEATQSVNMIALDHVKED
jgi:hypothetical protein